MLPVTRFRVLARLRAGKAYRVTVCKLLSRLFREKAKKTHPKTPPRSQMQLVLIELGAGLEKQTRLQAAGDLSALFGGLQAACRSGKG